MIKFIKKIWKALFGFEEKTMYNSECKVKCTIKTGRYTDDEVILIKECLERGLSYSVMGKFLNRKESSVRNKVRQLNKKDK